MTTTEIAISKLESNPVSHHVISAVADATGTDPGELEPLYHFVDPEALDRLFENPPSGAPRSRGRVTFTMAGCEVRVEATGEVEAHPLGESGHVR